MTTVRREIRIALVLYGGVSLAVYENGVTRCFYHLVRALAEKEPERPEQHGVFGLLRHLLDATATVDVVAGTSAGGINGLMLATALENGSDFTTTEDLWRRAADFGLMLRPASTAGAESLLDGEHYYQEQLLNAFGKLCRQRTDYQSPGEMDVFITTTDLDGRILDYVDDQGHRLLDKNHRVVFHLCHRPGRKRLGLTREQFERGPGIDPQRQILASVARMTSSFPAAFPPFRLEQIPDQHRDDVRTALGRASGRKDPGIDDTESFIDGGVLDNKPFMPALRAIFYRMPAGRVSRHLFYVEPDPTPFERPALAAGPPSPLKVASSALLTIPAHESIHGDLEALLEHNRRVAWMEHLRDNPGLDDGLGDLRLYAATRLESLGRALLVSGDGVPSARDQVGREHQALLDGIREFLPGKDQAEGWDQVFFTDLDRLDVDYHLRLAFHLLYHSYGRMGDAEHGEDYRRAVLLLGRLVKALEIVRASLLDLRTPLLRLALEQGRGQGAALLIRDACHRFLAAGAGYWEPLAVRLAPDIVLATLFDGEGTNFLCPDCLSELRKRTREAAREIDHRLVQAGEVLGETETVLDLIARATQRIVARYVPERGADPGAGFDYAAAMRLDRRFYPIQFTSGIHELDRIHCVRISPRDAQRGLSHGRLEDKVTGEDFAHFSAFLRRDWRSNDILRGRIDGICQIVETLMNDEAFAAMKGRAAWLSALFTPTRLRSFMSHCPAERLDELARAWTELRRAWEEGRSATLAHQALIEALITAGQYDAFLEGVGQVAEDLFYQDIKWGRRRLPEAMGRAILPEDVRASSGDCNVEHKAQELAEQHLRRNAGRPDKLWQWFAQIAPQKVLRLGDEGAVPRNIIGEYGSNAYLLLWEMLGRSMGSRAEALGGFRKYLYWPIRFLHYLHRLLRLEESAAAVLVITTGVALLVLGLASLFHGSLGWGLGALAALAIFMFLLPRMAPENRAGRLVRIMLSALAAAVLALAITGPALWLVEFIHQLLRGAR